MPLGSRARYAELRWAGASPGPSRAQRRCEEPAETRQGYGESRGADARGLPRPAGISPRPPLTGVTSGRIDVLTSTSSRRLLGVSGGSRSDPRDRACRLAAGAGGHDGLGQGRQVRERQPLARQHGQRLLRRAAVLLGDLEGLRRPEVRQPGSQGKQGRADRDRSPGARRARPGRLADLQPAGRSDQVEWQGGQEGRTRRPTRERARPRSPSRSPRRSPR